MVISSPPPSYLLINSLRKTAPPQKKTKLTRYIQDCDKCRQLWNKLNSASWWSHTISFLSEFDFQCSSNSCF